MIYVLDACAIIAFLRDEPGADVVAAALADADSASIAHALNLCEVYYDFHRASGESVAENAIVDLEKLGVQASEALTPDVWRKAAEIKSVHRRISLADCFALTLAASLDAELLTADHHELDAILKHGICRIRFIR